MINYMLDSSWGYLIWNNYKVTRVIFQFLSGFKPRVCCIKTDADIKVRTNRVLSRNPSCLVKKKKKKKKKTTRQNFIMRHLLQIHVNTLKERLNELLRYKTAWYDTYYVTNSFFIKSRNVATWQDDNHV